MTAPRARAAGRDDADEITPGEIERAVVEGKIVPWYQPIMDLSSSQPAGVEALARWERNPKPPRAPDRFLPVAEQSELILDLDRAMIAHALQDLSHWQAIQPGFRLSVNLSARHFASVDVVEQLQQLTAAAGVAQTTVDVEFTETVPPGDVNRAKEVTSRFRELGYRIWLDDFGTGWNSLEQLLNLSVDGLKIDRSFAAAMHTSTGRAVTESIAALAKRLGLLLTIEGVETPEQAAIAADLGCEYAQGFLWSAAVPGRDIRLTG